MRSSPSAIALWRSSNNLQKRRPQDGRGLLVAAIQILRHLRSPPILWSCSRKRRHHRCSRSSLRALSWLSRQVELCRSVCASHVAGRSNCLAEVNHPTWTKAIDTIWPRHDRHDHQAPLLERRLSASRDLLAVSPERSSPRTGSLASKQAWLSSRSRASCCRPERGRALALGLCIPLSRESHKHTQEARSLLSHLVSIQSPAINPPDSSPDPFIMMLHYALYRHFDFGRELLLTFLCHSVLGGNTLSLQSDVLTGQRMTIAIRAVLLTLDSHVKSQSPPFPSSADFHRFRFRDASRGMRDQLPEGFKYPKTEIARRRIDSTTSSARSRCFATTRSAT